MRLMRKALEKETLEPAPQMLLERREGGALRACRLVGPNRDTNKLMDNSIPEILWFERD